MGWHFVLFCFSCCDSEAALLVSSCREASATAWTGVLVPTLDASASPRRSPRARSRREHDGQGPRNFATHIGCGKRTETRIATASDGLPCLPIGSNGQRATWPNTVRASLVQDSSFKKICIYYIYKYFIHPKINN